MIFPAMRLSDLRRDVADKRLAFDRSARDLKSEVKRKLSPLNLLKENPQWLIAPAMSLFSAGTLGKFLVGLIPHRNGHSKNGNGSKKSQSGFLAGLLKFGGRTMFKSVTPLAFTAVKFAFKSALRSFRQRRA